MSLTHDQVLQFVKEHGPSVPNEIRQQLKGQDNFVVGAMLSELVGQGKLKLSHMSLGTSKFYYDPAHPEALEQVAHHLNEKDYRAQQLLLERSVIKNSELEPIMRVAMVNIPDFSRSLKIPAVGGETNVQEGELFWRYYLISEAEAIERIRSTYYGEVSSHAPVEQSTIVQTEQSEIRFGKKQKKQPEKSQLLQQDTHAPASSIAVPASSTPSTVPASTPSSLSTTKSTKTKRAKKTATPNFSEGFAKQLREYFDSKQIGLLQLVKATKTEITCTVSIPSAVGQVTYFCKAKSKKTTTDGDLASAVLEANQHKLPLFFIAGGTLSKKAQDIFASQLHGAVVVTPWA